MNWTDALEFAVSITKNERYRWLCSDANPSHEQWRSEIIRMAMNPPSSQSHVAQTNNGVATEPVSVLTTSTGSLATIPLAESLQLTKEMNDCPHFTRDSGCGCGRSRCKAGKGELDLNRNDGTGLISVWDCYNCLRPGVELYARNAYKKPT